MSGPKVDGFRIGWKLRRARLLRVERTGETSFLYIEGIVEKSRKRLPS